MPVVRRRHFWPMLWVPLALVLSFGLYFALKWGLKPKPIPQINPSQFESLEQVGAVTYRRLRSALRQEKMVVVGSAPWIRDYERLWNGFIAAAREDHWQIHVLFEDPTLRPIKDFSDLNRRPLAWPDASAQVIKEIKEDLRFGHLVVVHTTFNHSAHRGETSLVKELEAAFHRPWTALTMLGFAVTAEELENLQPLCIDEMAPTSRREYAACAAARLSRRFLRKHLDPTRIWAAVEQHGLKDYFIFVHEPTPPATDSDEPKPNQ